jgi:hypothetical protein
VSNAESLPEGRPTRTLAKESERSVQRRSVPREPFVADMDRLAWNIRQIDRSGESWWYRRWHWQREGKWS